MIFKQADGGMSEIKNVDLLTQGAARSFVSVLKYQVLSG